MAKEVTQETKDKILVEVDKIMNNTSDKNVCDLLNWVKEDLESQEIND
jgi:hypothetical protein